MSEAKLNEGLSKLEEMTTTLERVKGWQYAASISVTLRILMTHEVLAVESQNSSAKAILDNLAQDVLTLGMLATGVPDGVASRKEFTDNLIMLTKTVNDCIKARV